MKLDKSVHNPTVVKANSLIQAGYRLTMAEQRVLLSAMAQIDKDEQPTDQTTYSVDAHALSEISNTALKKAYEQLADTAIRLRRREIRIEKGSNGEDTKLEDNSTIITGWVQSIELKKSEGRIELRFSHEVLPYLSMLKREFTSYSLRHVATMKSTHGVRLYELLQQWRQYGEREIRLDELRRMFGVQKQYPNIRDLKRRVIEPAVKAVNNCSDLSVSWGQRKSGRRVVAIQFQFQSKNRKQLRDAVSQTEQPQPSNTYDPLAEQVAERRSRTPEAKEAGQIALAQLKSMTGIGEDLQNRDELEHRSQK